MEQTTHKLIIGDSRHLSLIPDQSVQLIVTSPPYWNIKDYGAEGQIGYSETYSEYFHSLSLVWQECFRVLQDGCKLCVNIGDQFLRAKTNGRYQVVPIHSDIITQCDAVQFDYMGGIVWHKVTNTSPSGGGAVMGSYPYPRNGIVKLNYEYILLFKKTGKPPKPTKEQKELSKMTPEEWNKYFSSHWNFTGAKQTGHVATFPDELPRRLIKMFSFVGETVLDPFMGSGTTAKVAKELGRNSIGYEINPDFEQYYAEKVGDYIREEQHDGTE